MTITHTNASPLFVRNQLADLIVDLLDVGTTNASGQVVIGTTGFAVILATIPLAAPPAFGDAAAGIATANGLPVEDSNAAATGTAAVFRVEDRDEREVFQGSVTGPGGGGDLELSSTGITTGDAVRLNTFTYAAPQ